MNLWEVCFYFQHSFHRIWEVCTDQRVGDKDDAIALIQLGIITNKASKALEDRYRWLKEALWRVDIGVPNTIEITFIYQGKEETIKVTSYRKDFIKFQRPEDELKRTT